MTSKKIFITANIFIAFIDRAHPKHLQASAFFRYFAQQQNFLYTTSDMISDVHTVIAQSISPILAKDFIKSISLGSINILYPEEADVKLAFKTLINSSSPDLSFQEALVASVANRREIPFICTLNYLHPMFGLQVFYLPI